MSSQQPLLFGDDPAAVKIRETLQRTCPRADALQIQQGVDIFMAYHERNGVTVDEIIAWLTNPRAIHTDAGWRAHCDQWLEKNS